MNEQLVELALEARTKAYAPYSKYLVGAALRAVSGNTYTGCNVENTSYGLTVCAERNAVAAMIANGDSEIAEIAVATMDGAPPCGACRQVLSEFSSSPASLKVYLVNEEGIVTQTTLAHLFPSPFR